MDKQTIDTLLSFLAAMIGMLMINVIGIAIAVIFVKSRGKQLIKGKKASAGIAGIFAAFAGSLYPVGGAVVLDAQRRVYIKESWVIESGRLKHIEPSVKESVTFICAVIIATIIAWSICYWLTRKNLRRLKTEEKSDNKKKSIDKWIDDYSRFFKTATFVRALAGLVSGLLIYANIQ